MFCPSCGFEYTQKTNYCKRCGEELNAAPQGDGIGPRRFPAAGIFAIVALFGAVGLLMNLVSHYKLIQRLNVRPDDAMVSLALGLLLVGGVAGLLIWQLSRLITAFQKSNQAPAQERVIIRESQVPQIGGPSDSIRSVVGPHSVVEHTTRQMASVYSEPKATK
jgi:uncharacterized protein (DUF983 family)